MLKIPIEISIFTFRKRDFLSNINVKVSIMKRNILITLVSFLFIFALAAPSSAIPINKTWTFELQKLGAGADSLGLHGATLTLNAVWDGNYGDVFGVPGAFSTFDSLTVAGASVTSTNSTYNAPGGILFAPDWKGQLYTGNLQSGTGIDYTAAGLDLVLQFLLNNDGAPVNIGDPIKAADFGTFGPQTVSRGTDGTFYSVASVPDASIMLLLGSSLIGLVVFSRRSKRS
jgi:hypothetical protein